MKLYAKRLQTPIEKVDICEILFSNNIKMLKINYKK